MPISRRSSRRPKSRARTTPARASCRTRPRLARARARARPTTATAAGATAASPRARQPRPARHPRTTAARPHPRATSPPAARASASTSPRTTCSRLGSRRRSLTSRRRPSRAARWRPGSETWRRTLITTRGSPSEKPEARRSPDLPLYSSTSQPHTRPPTYSPASLTSRQRRPQMVGHRLNPFVPRSVKTRAPLRAAGTCTALGPLD